MYKIQCGVHQRFFLPQVLSPGYEETVEALLESYQKKVTCSSLWRRQQSKVLRVEAAGTSMKKVCTEVFKHPDYEEAKEIEVFCSELMILNRSVSWPGKNLVLVSPVIHVRGDVNLDLSGENAINGFKEKKAVHG